MSLYDLQNIPSTHSWVQKLNASQAIAQCHAWNLQPADTLEANRAILRQFIIEYNTSHVSETEIKNTDTITDQSQSSTSSSGERTATQTQQQQLTHNTTSSSNEDFTKPPLPLTDTVTQTTTTPTIQTTINLTDPNLQALITSLQSMTHNAIAQTTAAITSQLKFNTQSTSHTEDNKCPPLIRDLLRELPKTSGQDPHQVILFCKDLHKIVEMNIVPERVVLTNVLPYTTDRFRQFWMTTTAQNPNWEHLLKNIRQNFFTTEVLRQMQNHYLYRHQATTEQLADYVRDMQLLYLILSPATQPDEIFQNIFRGINPHTRTTFAGLKPIATIQDLINVAPLSSSLAQPPTDLRYHTTQGSHNQSNQNYTPQTNHYTKNNRPWQNNFHTNRPRQFYGQRYTPQQSGFRPQYHHPTPPRFQGVSPQTNFRPPMVSYAQGPPQQSFAPNQQAHHNRMSYQPYIPPFNVYPHQNLNPHGGDQ